jgi:DNA-binding phage protein
LATEAPSSRRGAFAADQIDTARIRARIATRMQVEATTFEQVATELGVGRTTLWRVCERPVETTLEQICKVVRRLGLPLREVVPFIRIEMWSVGVDEVVGEPPALGREIFHVITRALGQLDEGLAAADVVYHLRQGIDQLEASMVRRVAMAETDGTDG